MEILAHVLFLIVIFLNFAEISSLVEKRDITTSATKGSNAPTILSAVQGSFSSPNYPQNYPRNITSSWDIWTGVQPTATLVLTFTYFDVESCRHCSCDYVEIVTDQSSTKRHLCGSVLPSGDGKITYTYTNETYCKMRIVCVDRVSGYVHIKFVSDTNQVQRSGFFANYVITGRTASTTSTSTIATTVSCYAVKCPQCATGSVAVYKYFHNYSCPSFCECEQTTIQPPLQTTSTHNGSTTKTPCVETYANQGYIKTKTIKRPYLHGYPPLYLLNYDCKLRIDLGSDYILKDKSVRIRFLKFDLDHCKYGYDGHTCRCDYVTLINVRGLEKKRICDAGYIDFNKDYYFRPSSRSDRYVEMSFLSDLFLVKTGYLIEYEVIDSYSPVCINSTCSSACNFGHVVDFAGCTMCQCVTTTTTTTRATTTRATTPTLFKSRLLTKLQNVISEMQSLYKEVKYSRVLDYARK